MKNAILKLSILIGCIMTFHTNVACSMGQRLPASEDNSSSTTPSTPTTPEEPSVPSNPPPSSGGAREVVPLWESKHSQGKLWTAHVDKTLDTLGEDLLDVIPADRTTFCPRYSSLTYAQRKEFWTYMLSAMVRFESNFKPETSYTESFSDSSGRRVVSRGLLQISIESGNAYGCGFKSTKDLHDPYQNLSCGIRILNRWVGRDARIAGKVGTSWRGGARYWSVLRAGNKTSYQSIVSWSKNLSFCK
ncbi:transglycosylase SLT domain-containing protein [Bdellovibrio sp. 22V]|uniref:transglycosylase SLT domain-containing protein n=1 Tax=Bdellovibrio TaxID=958 RepID=UPI002542B404|nr:transglycosylase SLT domain-containing protein [Bdellovibrio sp. 22V]WII72132.1 transglycosylase SLT domain-containing protein [Bdellovibrio sp. 22V]